MPSRKRMRASRWGVRVVALCLILALAPGCRFTAAQIYIPLAYGLAGLSVALLMSPTLVAAVVGFMAGVLLGAAVYNNSLKRQLLSSPPTGPPHVLQ